MTFTAGLLDGSRVALAGDGAAAAAIDERLRDLGATVATLAEPELLSEDDAAAWAGSQAPLHALVVAAGDSFGAGGAGRLAPALELVWRAVRGVGTGALIEASAPGRIVLVAPRPDAGRHAQAARAALENLARTLAVEWARFQITAVAVTPGPATTDAEVAELVAFLLSAAGGYFSGCRFDLGTTPLPATA